MESQNDKGATWPAIYFIREDLKMEKNKLIEDMMALTMNYWGGTDPEMDDVLKQINFRIEEINDIVRNVTLNLYTIDPDD